MIDLTEPDWENYNLSSAVPKDIRAEIGSVIMTQSALELELRILINRTIGLNANRVNIVSAELSYKQLISVLASILIQDIGKDSDYYKDFERISANLERFEQFRNTVAHSHWSHSIEDMGNQTKAARHKTSAKKRYGLKHETTEITLNDLATEVKKVHFYIQKLYELIRLLYKNL